MLRQMETNIKFDNGDHLLIDSSSYERYCNKYLPEWARKIEPVNRSEVRNAEDGIQCRTNGKAKFIKMTAPKETVIDVFAGDREGYCSFSDEVAVPLLMLNGSTWMSLTPMEIISQRAGLRKAKGNVLVLGLGMGWLAQACLERRQVDSVTVIERDEKVIELFGDTVEKKQCGAGNQSFVIKDDAYDYARKHHPEFDCILFDIWEGCGQAIDDRQYQEIKLNADCPVWAWGEIVPRRYR